MVEFAQVESVTAAKMREIMGEPPDWYYPLVGRVATETGLLEHWVVMTALHLAERPDTDSEAAFWSSENGRIRILLDLVKGKDEYFDKLARRLLQEAAVRRNRIVHATVMWADVDDPNGPHGWYAHHPRSGPQWLTPEAQEAMVVDLQFIQQASSEIFAEYLKVTGRQGLVD